MTTIRAAEQLNAENPWPGLEAFEENARAFFRGRDRESESLLDNVLDAPVTVLYGRSGLGKTSLLRAGLFPLLRERNFLPIYVRFDLKPESLPVVQQILNTVRTSVCTEVADAVQPAEDESLWEYLHRSDFQLWNAQNYPLIPVIVLDQFEEIFTLGERVPELVRAFETDLGDLAENRIPSGLAARIATDDTLAARFQMRSRKYKLLISLREDFLPDLEGWRQLIPGLGRSRIRLQRLRVAEAFDAVYGPAGHMMTEELARRIVGIIAAEDIHRGRDTATPDSSSPDGPSQLDECDSEEVEPALLSLFCRELNEERKRLHKKVFDAHLVEEAKGDILSNYYTSCVGDLPPQVAKFIETELITEKGFRNSYARDDAVPSHLTDDELTRLIRLRLLRVEERYGAQWIELTHDVLTSVVREHRDRRCAEEEKAALTARAEQERQAAAQREAELEERQQAAEALAAREQAHAADLRRRSRILRRVLVVTAIIAVIAVFFAVAATYSRWEATKAKQESTKAKQERTALRLASEGQAMFAGLRPGGEVRALQELLASQRVASVAGPGVLFPAVFRRRDTLKIIPASDRVMSVAVSPDGRRIVAASPDGRLRLWAADTGQPLGAPLTGHTDRVNSVAFSPDGRFIVSGSSDRTVRLWNAETGQPIGQRLTGHTEEIKSVAFSPDGRLIVSADDHSLRLWPGPAAWSDALCAKLTQNLSPHQWSDWVKDIGYTIQCPGLPKASDEGPSRQIELPFHGLSHPQAITVDAAGNVYVADTGNNRVVKLGAGATNMTELPFSGLNGPNGVAVDRAGTVYVVDENNRVLKLPHGSTSAVQLPFTGLNTPSDVTVDAPGNVYVVDAGNARVLKLAAGSTSPTTLPFTDIRVPNTIAVDTTGNVFVTDQGNDRLLELPAGTTAPSELPCGGLDGAGGVAVDTAGNVYLASYNSNHVLELAKGQPAPSALPFTGLNEPNAVAVGTHGTVYVTDAGNNRVIKLPPQS